MILFSPFSFKCLNLLARGSFLEDDLKISVHCFVRALGKSEIKEWVEFHKLIAI